MRAWRIAAQCTAEADESNEGAHNKGSVDNEAEASTTKRAYVAHAASNNNKAAASAVKARAYKEGSDRDEAAASAARHVYAASVAAADNKAAASAARRARAGIAALRMAKADEINDGAHNEGFLNNEAEASVARHAYAARATSDDDEASASAARRAHAAIVA